jgi:hypothetical protein
MYPGLMHIDSPAAGTHVYFIAARSAAGCTASFNNYRLWARELF